MNLKIDFYRIVKIVSKALYKIFSNKTNMQLIVCTINKVLTFVFLIF